ncbi:MAG TPA: serine hydroxymethyltransferase [bacterium]|nr:serine hydroxymethyltransferase [bacterium]
MNFGFLKSDPEVLAANQAEVRRQNDKLELIASENFTSLAVMAAQGGVMTNKYAEGYPGNRYYGGCENVDRVENLARERASQLFFGAEYVNVQPHSGSQANMAVYFTFVKPGDVMMGLDLSHGGHLTHGSKVNFSGKMYNFFPYQTRESDGRVDLDQVQDLARKHRPKMISIGASAYSRDWDYAAFRKIADEVGAFLWADIAHTAGLIAAGELNNPMPHCHVVTTTTHKTLRGPRGGLILMGKDFENPFGLTAPKSGRTRKMGELLDSQIIPGIQGGPLMHVVAAKAVAFKEALDPSFKAYAKQIKANAKALCEALMEKGFKIVSGGTDNHLMLIDLRNKKVNGKQAQLALDEAGITTNKNSVPFDTESPLLTSGLRLGTPALTTRGFKEKEMKQVADWINRVIEKPDSEAVRREVLAEIGELTPRFPLYPELLREI